MDEEVFIMMREQVDELRKIYGALADDISKKLYKHRLLYSLFREKEEINKLVYEYSPECAQLNSSKVCYYGAGAGANWIVKYDARATFVIDKYKIGSVEGLPIISLDDFLNLPDCREYLIIITVGDEAVRNEIKTELEGYGLKYLFAYFDMQYFDLPALNLQNEFFVDAGALNGETTKYFLDHFRNGHAYVLEPNPEQFAVSKKTLNGYPGVEFYQYGLYDKDTTIGFDLCGGDAGSAKLSESGELSIEVRRLDDLLQDKKVTFIKMDIEGSELAALKGAEQIIRRQKPKLAICIYHKLEDVWKIPGLILEYCPEYRLYLRHYSISKTETVLYAVL